MPLNAGSIDTGDAISGNITYSAVNGTPPYTYELSFAGISGSGIVANVGGLEGNVVTFDASLARAGTYVIEVRGKVTDDLGDVDQDDPDDVDTLTVTILPIVAAWDVGPTWVPADIEQAATTATSATLAVSTGGLAPYNYLFEIVGGAPAGISLVQADPTDNVIEIISTDVAVPGVYNLVIRGQVSDATGQFEGPFDLNVTLTVLGMRNFVWSPTSIPDEPVRRGSASGSSTIVDGLGGVGPYTYLMFWVDQPDNITLNQVGPVASFTPSLVAALEQVTGSIRGRVTDTVGNQVEIDLPFTLTVLEFRAGNSAFAKVIELGATHFWPLDEVAGTTGDFLDATGSLDLSPKVGDEGDYGRQMPGPFRGEPYQGALSFVRNTGATNIFNATGPTSVGDTTGTLVCWVNMLELALAESSVMVRAFNNNSSIWGGLAVTSSGELIGEVTQGDNPRIRSISAAGVITIGSWAMISMVQRADGNGIRIGKNGVDVTDSQLTAGTATVNSWFDDIITTETAATMVLSALTTIGINPSRKIMAMPALWVNTALSDQQLLEMHESANLTGPPTDYHETFIDKFGGPDLRLWWTGSMPTTQGEEAHEMGVIDSANNREWGASDYASATLNQETTYPANYNYANRKAVWSPGDRFNVQLLTGHWRNDTDDSVGTFNAWVKIQSVGAGLNYILSMGQFGTSHHSLGIDGDRFRFQMQHSADQYTLAVNPLANPDFLAVVGGEYMVTVVQDGLGMAMYINGEAVEGGDRTESSSGSFDDTIWFSGLTTPSQWQSRIGNHNGGGSLNNWDPNEISEFAYKSSALSALDIAEIYAAGI